MVDWTILVDQLSEYGIVGVMILVALFFGYQELNKRDATNKERIDDLKSDIELLRDENKEERDLFREVTKEITDGFHRALNKITNDNNDVKTLNNKIDNLEIDVNYIKNNMKKE